MYGLPADVDLDFLHGKTLLQVCIGMHDLILNFDPELIMTITSSIGIDSERPCEEFRRVSSKLSEFIGLKIVSAHKMGTGTLKLQFDDQRHLFIFDNSKEFESYTIKSGKRIIVV